MDGLEGVPLQDEATLFQVISTKDTHNGHISKLPHEPEERGTANEPAVPNHCPGFDTWMKDQDLTSQQHSSLHVLC